jgi:hypothetical protein
MAILSRQQLRKLGHLAWECRELLQSNLQRRTLQSRRIELLESNYSEQQGGTFRNLWLFSMFWVILRCLNFMSGRFRATYEDGRDCVFRNVGT